MYHWASLLPALVLPFAAPHRYPVPQTDVLRGPELNSSWKVSVAVPARLFGSIAIVFLIGPHPVKGRGLADAVLKSPAAQDAWGLSVSAGSGVAPDASRVVCSHSPSST